MSLTNSVNILRDNLNEIENIKGQIKNAIENKGQNVNTFNSYPSAIENIMTGENLSNVLNAQDNRIAELESALENKTSDLSCIDMNLIVPPPSVGGSGTSDVILSSEYVTQLPNFNFSINPNYNLYLTNSFCNCHNLISVPNWNTSKVIGFVNTFSRCRNLKTVPNFDTSNVTSMANMFCWCTNLNLVPNFNTSKVTNMANMLTSCSNITSVPNWNTSNVTNMLGMFTGCNNLTNVPNFNTSKVTTMSSMLYGCAITSAPNFDTSNVTDMGYIFANCFNLVDIPQYNVSKVMDSGLSSIAQYCNNLSDASIQNIINMCLNSNTVKVIYKNLMVNTSYSPFFQSNITNDRYQNRWEELTAAGWTF